MYRIMIVEDDAAIASMIGDELSGWGYEATTCTDFSDVMAQFGRLSPDLVLLDLSLPFRSGFHWCAEIRKVSNVPIIFISSASDNMNQLTALHQGGDDFVAKPFDMALLVAKVQAVLRRAYDFSGAEETLSCGKAVLDLGAMCIRFGEARLELTKNEFRILQTLFESGGRVTGRDTIIRRLWADENFIDDNTLTVNVNRLRRKLETIGLGGLIVTKKGEGYMLDSKRAEACDAAVF